jgi:2-iminoacetate synthase
MTSVGGRMRDAEENAALEQFSISDKRDVKDMIKLLRERGYQPVFKDWMRI